LIVQLPFLNGGINMANVKPGVSLGHTFCALHFSLWKLFKGLQTDAMGWIATQMS
jgi:hypothetical protein